MQQEKEKVKASILWLKELSKDDVLVAGGKGANLAEMFNAGLPVPPAFVVTAQAFERFMRGSGLHDKVHSIIKAIDMENTAQLESEAKRIQQLIVAAKMPDELRKEILEAYDSLSAEKELLEEVKEDVMKLVKAGAEVAFTAVRSSATTEDLATASFAGQQETFLNVKGADALIDAVLKCWASLFTARAIYYRERKGFEHETAYIAVIVQKMINSDKAGVIFTVDPITNEPKIVIEACYGLGEGVVSGATAPDKYVVDKATLKLLEKHVPRKTIYFTRDSAGKNVKLDLPPEKVAAEVLTASEIKQLANLAIKIEQHYKAAQDIEWGIEAGNIYMLQTRPVTTKGKVAPVAEIKATVLLDGLPASPGIGSGTVKIVYTLADLAKIEKGDILVTKMTNPDMVVTMQKSAAIVTDEGGLTAHAAIVSREVGLPCIVGTRKATKVLKEGQIITVDGSAGKVYEGAIKPEEIKEEVKEEVKKEKIEEKVPPAPAAAPAPPIEEMPKLEKEEKAREAPKFQPPTKTKIYMNLGEPWKIKDYKDLFFDGIGLMRIEFIIASQIKQHPRYLIEIGQSDRYIWGLAAGIATVAKAIYPRPIVVRFSDFKSNEYKGLEGGEKYEEEEANPMLGFRGASRYTSEEFKDAFKLECKAIKKVRESFDNVHVMLPFIRTTDEVNKCLAILREEGLEKSESFKIWLMAEVPSMALIPEEFAKLPIDGISIGSNDLTQLTLGVDRDSALLSRMGYFDERNPAVLKALHNLISTFKAENKTTSICGQAPSVYPEIVEFLVKQGITSISVNPDAVNKTRQMVAELEKQSEKVEEKQQSSEEKVEKAQDEPEKVDIF